MKVGGTKEVLEIKWCYISLEHVTADKCLEIILNKIA